MSDLILVDVKQIDSSVFFFRAFGWKSVLRLEVSRKLDPPLGNTSTSTYTYYQLYLYAIFHLPLLGAATVVKGAPTSHLCLLCVLGITYTQKYIGVLFLFCCTTLVRLRSVLST